MPDVFEKFFGDFGKSVSDYYTLERLDPGYQVYFGKGDSIMIGDSLEKIYAAFETVEKGSSIKLKSSSPKRQIIIKLPLMNWFIVLEFPL